MHHLLELYYIKCTALNVEKKIPSGPVFVVAVGKTKSVLLFSDFKKRKTSDRSSFLASKKGKG